MARCTPRGESGVAMVRLSGPHAVRVGREIFRTSPALGRRTRYVQVGTIRAQGNEIDRGLAWVMRAPSSYTGEDTVEISCHGSMAVVDRVIAEATRLGARVAEPGEFTRRAFLSGKLDLMEAEGVVDLIRAGAGVVEAYGVAGGRLSRWVRSVRARAIQARAEIEVGLDFGDEQVGGPSRAELAARIGRLAAEAGALRDGFESTRRRMEGSLVALVGRKNVGKSTLLNALAGEDRAIVTDEAGTTRDLVEARVTWEGESVRLVDTAGLGRPENAAERAGIERTLETVRQADVVVVVVDGSRSWGQGDAEAVRMAGGAGRLIAVNKADLQRRLAIPGGMGLGGKPVSVSGKTGEGLAALIKAIGGVLPGGATSEQVGLTRERHAALVGRMAMALSRAEEGIRRGELDECCAVELGDAVEMAAELLGEDVGEAVLDRIFSQFCIGK